MKYEKQNDYQKAKVKIKVKNNTFDILFQISICNKLYEI